MEERAAVAFSSSSVGLSRLSNTVCKCRQPFGSRGTYSAAQLKTIREVITLCVFCVFSVT